MKKHARELLSLFVALMLVTSGAMAGMDNYVAFMKENAPVSEVGGIDFLPTDALEYMADQATTNAMTDDTITYMLESIHWLDAFYYQAEGYARKWCVPVEARESSASYIARVGNLFDEMGGYPDDWMISDAAFENYEEVTPLYYSAETQTVVIESRLRPSVEPRGYVEDAAGQTGYGFRFVEENGESRLALGVAALERNGGHYTVPSGAFADGSPVYTESGLLVGVSDGGTNVYSIAGISDEISARNGDVQEEPTEVSAEVSADEPSAAPVAAPVDEEDDASKAGGMDDDDKIKLIVGAVVVVLAAAFFWRKRKSSSNKDNGNNPTPPGRPKFNAKPFTPNYGPQGDVTAALNDNAAAPQNGGIGKTVLVSEPAKKRVVAGIRCVGGTMNGAVIRIEREVRIGRDPKRCSIVYPEKERGISGLHCAVAPTADGVLTLTDLGSSYGTTVNGRKLSANVPCVLHAGDRFALADGNNCFEVFTEEI